MAAGARQRSSSDASNCMSSGGLRNGVDPRASPAADSNSSTASEASEPADDCPFSPGTEPKRARSLSPINSTKLVDMKRRNFEWASKSVLFDITFIQPHKTKNKVQVISYQVYKTVLSLGNNISTFIGICGCSSVMILSIALN